MNGGMKICSSDPEKLVNLAVRVLGTGRYEYIRSHETDPCAGCER